MQLVICGECLTGDSRVLLRITGAQRKRPDHRMTSYNRALEITGSESIEENLATKRRLWARMLIRERRAVTKAVYARKSGGCSAEKTGWVGEREGLFRTKRRLGVSRSRGLETDGIGGSGGVDWTVT